MIEGEAEIPMSLCENIFETGQFSSYYCSNDQNHLDTQPLL